MMPIYRLQETLLRYAKYTVEGDLYHTLDLDYEWGNVFEFNNTIKLTYVVRRHSSLLAIDEFLSITLTYLFEDSSVIITPVYAEYKVEGEETRTRITDNKLVLKGEIE